MIRLNSGRPTGGRPPARRANGLTLVAGLVFAAFALTALGVLAWGLWWQMAKVAAPLTLVVAGVIGIVWSQQRSSRRQRGPSAGPGTRPRS